jgi:hypothetical protein
MIHLRLPLWGLVFALFSFGCSDSKPTIQTSPPVPAKNERATIQVLVDQKPFSQIVVPAEGDSWSLSSLLPDGLPPQAEWLRVRFSAAKVHHTIPKPGTAFKESVAVELSSKGDQLRFKFFDLLGSKTSPRQSEQPHRILVDPVSIEVITVEPVPDVAWPRLRVAVGKQGIGQLEEPSITVIPQTKNPFKPMHDGGWTVRQIVGLYTDEFSAVEFKSKDKTVQLTRAQVDSSATILLRATKKGFWVFKRWEAGNTGEPDETVRNITELRITR